MRSPTFERSPREMPRHACARTASMMGPPGQRRPRALAEGKRYTFNRAYQLSYLLGKHLIKELRDSARKELGARYSDRWFHDAILYAGSLPFKYLREEIDKKIPALAA